ncbi:Secreted protein [Pseudomonas chlororaphis]
MVIVRVDRQHFLFSAGWFGAHSLAAPGFLENGRSGQKGIDMAKTFDRNSPPEAARRPIAGRQRVQLADGT